MVLANCSVGDFKRLDFQLRNSAVKDVDFNVTVNCPKRIIVSDKRKVNFKSLVIFATEVSRVIFMADLDLNLI